MKKMAQLIGVFFLLLFISGSSGCPPKKPTPAPGPTPALFYQNLSKGENAEARKDLAKALDYYKQALIAAPSSSNEQVEAHKRVLRVENKVNLAKKYCRTYKKMMQEGKISEAGKVLTQVRHIWPFYTECRARAISAQQRFEISNVGRYQILNEKPVIYKIRYGDIISKLCQKYYGRTGNYKLVSIITHYNKINSKSLHKGQKIKFPSIQLNGKIYRPKGSHAPNPTPTITIAPQPTPSPTIVATPTPTPEPLPSVTPEPTPEPMNYYNQAIALFRSGRYADASAMLSNVSDTSPEKEDSLRMLFQCHFRLAQGSMEKGHYREARDRFAKAFEICQRLQGSVLPPECKQIEELIGKCDDRIKSKEIEAYLDKGRQLLKANRIDPAIKEFEKVLALEPRHGDALEYLYLTHFKKAHRLWKGKAYQEALEEFMTAWEYNQNCEECRISINKIKSVLYSKAKALEKTLLEPTAPSIKILQQQIEYYTIIIQLDPDYEDVAELLEKAGKRKKYLEGKKRQKSE